MKLSTPIILLASAASSLAVPHQRSSPKLATTLFPRDSPIALKIFMTEYTYNSLGIDNKPELVWEFDDVTSGPNAGCNTKLVHQAAVKASVPGGDFPLEVAGRNCSYMNNGANDGALWCGGHPNRCYFEDGALQRQNEDLWKTCQEMKAPDTPKVRQLHFVRCELQAS
jgi:hypothetical protein